MFFGKLKNSNDYGFGCFEDRFESYKDIDDDYHMALVEKAISEGKLISGDKYGNPILVDPPPPTDEEVKQRRLNELESYLSQTDWYAIRFADAGEPIPEGIKQKRQEARDEISALRND